jgi:hypothetical protein
MVHQIRAATHRIVGANRPGFRSPHGEFKILQSERVSAGTLAFLQANLRLMKLLLFIRCSSNSNLVSLIDVWLRLVEHSINFARERTLRNKRSLKIIIPVVKKVKN